MESLSLIQCVFVLLSGKEINTGLFLELMFQTKKNSGINSNWNGVVVYSIYLAASAFGGLGVACWPLVPKFAGSNPAEAVGFFRAKKSSARLPSEGK
jgi:hypothetical protein